MYSFNRFRCKLTEIALFIAELWEPHTHIHVHVGKICKGLKITANVGKSKKRITREWRNKKGGLLYLHFAHTLAYGLVCCNFAPTLHLDIAY